MARQRVVLTCVALLLAPVLLAAPGLSAHRAAAQPIITGEIGPNDLRISTMGPDGDTAYYALDPAVAYNEAAGEFLVVWAADDEAAPLGDDEFEIYGQRVAEADGTLLGARVRISVTGPDGDPAYYARDPDVAFNPTTGEYLVVWAAGGGAEGLAAGELEIYGQRLDAAGSLLGAAIRISDMGPDGDPAYDALNPAAAYNPATAEVLVVWQGDDTADNAVEIYGQRLAGDGSELGTNDARLSDMGADDAGTSCRGQEPAVTCGPASGECLVVWEGSDDTPPLVPGEFEVFGQRLAADGSEIGDNDARLSDMGPDGDPAYGADHPGVAYGPRRDEYLAVWAGDDDRDFGGGPLAEGELEVYGQRLAAGGSEVGENDFRVSQVGPDGDPAYKAFGAAVLRAGGSWFVVWRADGDTPLVDDEMEIWGQELHGTGVPHGGAVRLSDMGPDGDAAYGADRPAVAVASESRTALTVWQGDDDAAPLVEGEVEVLGQLYALELPLYAPPVAGDDTYTATEDTPLEVAAPGLLENDVEPDGDPMVVQEYTQPAHGTVVVQPDGSFAFTPDPNACGADGFTYVVSDGLDGSDEGAVSLEVACVNDTPDAVDDSASTTENSPAVIHATANDTDVEGLLDPATAAVVTPPAHGLVTGSGTGSFAYVPAPFWRGTDLFTYQVCDAEGACDTATVTVEVAQVWPRLHVGEIQTQVRRSGPQYALKARVPILGQAGEPIAAATVSGTWVRPDGSKVSQSKASGKDGFAIFDTQSALVGTYWICVTNVTKSGLVYEPGLNADTCDLITAVP
jgi:hypothetical protein